MNATPSPSSSVVQESSKAVGMTHHGEVGERNHVHNENNTHNNNNYNEKGNSTTTTTTITTTVHQEDIPSSVSQQQQQQQEQSSSSSIEPQFTITTITNIDSFETTVEQSQPPSTSEKMEEQILSSSSVVVEISNHTHHHHHSNNNSHVITNGGGDDAKPSHSPTNNHNNNHINNSSSSLSSTSSSSSTDQDESTTTTTTTTAVVHHHHQQQQQQSNSSDDTTTTTTCHSEYVNVKDMSCILAVEQITLDGATPSSSSFTTITTMDNNNQIMDIDENGHVVSEAEEAEEEAAQESSHLRIQLPSSKEEIQAIIYKSCESGDIFKLATTVSQLIHDSINQQLSINAQRCSSDNKEQDLYDQMAQQFNLLDYMKQLTATASSSSATTTPTTTTTMTTDGILANNNNNNSQMFQLTREAQLATINFIDPQSGYAPIHIAVLNNHMDCVSFLSKCQTIDLNLTCTIHEQTALHKSVFYNFVGMTHMLLQRGANHGLADKHGETPVMLSARLNHDNCSSLMVEYGADVSVLYDSSRLTLNDNKDHHVNSNNNSSSSSSSTGHNDMNNSSSSSSSGNVAQYDRYGWTIGSGHSIFKNGSIGSNASSSSSNNNSNNNGGGGASSRQSRKIRVRSETPLLDKFRDDQTDREEERVAKWRKMLRKSAEKRRKKPDFIHRKLKERVRKGIPDAVRGQAWIVITRSDELKLANPGVYQHCLKQPSVHSKQIDLDVKREFREHRLFAKRYGHGQIMLYNVLKAYSVYNPNLGYTQGMSILAALLLMYMEEEDAFWTFATIMKHPKHLMEATFAEGLPRLAESFYVHERLLSKHMGKLFAHMNEHSVLTSAYATRWYMQVMIGILPWDVALVVWDLFLSEGYKVIYSIVYSLMKLLEKDLIGQDFEVLLTRLSHLDKHDIDATKLLKISVNDKIKAKKLLKYENEYAKKRAAPTNNNKQKR